MNTITIEVMGQQEVYDLLSILDFDNVRKRMSVSHQKMSCMLADFKSGRFFLILFSSSTSNGIEVQAKNILAKRPSRVNKPLICGQKK